MSDEIINILLVDDIRETRESIKKLLAFESDFKVVGTAGNGVEGVELAKELRPDIIIMDINMPDMDGLEAANLITKAVPTVGVIMMSVQNDADYMQRAMLAGARFFLSKPVNMDDLYSTIRNVYEQYRPIRERERAIGEISVPTASEKIVGEGGRAGHVIVVYSPQGGAGCTTISTNIASGLMKEGIKVLLIDADLQFGDVGMFLNLSAESTIMEIAENVDDLDTDFFENIVATHDSGLKALLGPPRPAMADEIRENNPSAVAEIIEKILSFYDFIIVDTSSTLDGVVVPLLDIATKVLLITNPTLPSINNSRRVLHLFDQLGYPPEKVSVVINRASEERGRKQATISGERIQNWLKRPVYAQIPAVDERIILSAINKGVPVIASDRDQNKPPIRQYIDLSDNLFRSLMGEEVNEQEDDESNEKRGLRLFGR